MMFILCIGLAVFAFLIFLLGMITHSSLKALERANKNADYWETNCLYWKASSEDWKKRWDSKN